MTAAPHRSARRDRGFTLVEVVIAIVVVALLSTTVVIGIGQLTDRGADTACTTSADAARTASAAHWATTGTHPTSFTDLTTSGALTVPADATLTANDLLLTTGTWALALTSTPPTYTCVEPTMATVLQRAITFDTTYRTLLTTQPALTPTQRITTTLTQLPTSTVAPHQLDPTTTEFSLTDACIALTLPTNPTPDPITPRLTICQPPTPPDAPTNLTTTRVPGNATSLTLTWTPPTNTGRRPITDYIIEHTTNGTYQRIDDGTTTLTTHTLTGLTTETPHTIRIAAITTTGQSPWTTTTATPSLRPDNDHLTDATPLTFPAPNTDWTGPLVSLSTATIEPGESTQRLWVYNVSRSAWWKFTPTTSVLAAIGASTPGGIGHPHTMATLRATPSVSAPIVTGCLAWNGSNNCLSDSVVLTAGRTYWLQIDGGNPLTAPRIRTYDLVPPPSGPGVANDRIDDAASLPALDSAGDQETATVTMTNATIEGAEIGARTVWWTHTPTRTETVAFSGSVTSGAMSMTLRSAADVAAVPLSTCSGTPSCTFTRPLTADTTYWIQLNASTIISAQTGTVIAANAPANDHVVDATTITFPAPDTDWTGTTVNLGAATLETGETTQRLWVYNLSRSGWWSFTPDADTLVAIGATTPPSPGHPHTMVTVRATPSVTAPIVTGCLAWGGSSGCLSDAMVLTGGQTYWLQIDGGSPLAAPRLRTYSRHVPPPAHDAAASPAVITTAPFGGTGTAAPTDATFATAETGETGVWGTVMRSVWWSYTPTQDQVIRFSAAVGGTTVSRGGITVRASASATAPIIASCFLESNQTTCSVPALSLTAGTTYYVQVYSNAANTGGSWTVTPAASNVLTNDNIAHPTAIAPVANGSTWTSSTTNTTMASIESGELAWLLNSGRSIWYSYTPSSNQTVRFGMNAIVPHGVTGVRVWAPAQPVGSAATVSNSAALAVCSNNSGPSCQSGWVTLTGGTTYYVQVYNQVTSANNWQVQVTVQAQ